MPLLFASFLFSLSLFFSYAELSSSCGLQAKEFDDSPFFGGPFQQEKLRSFDYLLIFLFTLLSFSAFHFFTFQFFFQMEQILQNPCRWPEFSDEQSVGCSRCTASPIKGRLKFLNLKKNNFS